MFIFVTAFALVYVYYGKPFSSTRFWKRRALGVLLPYCVWSFIYLWLSQSQHSPGSFTKTLIIDIISGQASYQLYYILISLQFYILFPLFLPFVGFIKKHPWKTLAISFVLEELLLYVDYHTLERNIGTNSSFWQFIAAYQYCLVFTYQFYFILGALAAIYLQQIRSFLQRYGWWTLPGFLVALLTIWVHFFIQVLYNKEPLDYATSVLQPIMTFYSLAVIAFFFWLAYLWAEKVDQAGHPRLHRIWGTLSDASFGTYLIHAIFLNWFMLSLIPAMPYVWPVAMRVLLTWFITAGCSIVASIALMNIPILRHLVGRSRSLSGGILQLRGLKKQAL